MMQLGQLELNRVHNMDVIEGLRMLPDNSVDLVVCDPPYGIDFSSNMRKKNMLKTASGIANDGKNNEAFLESVLAEIARVMKPNSHIYWFTRWDKVPSQQPMLEEHFTVKNNLIWYKNNKSMGDLYGAYASQYENILFAHKGRRLLNEVDGTVRHIDVLEYKRVASQRLVHSHQKPTDLIDFLVRKSSDPGQVVLVPFCGSGSECVAAKAAGRQFISFELEPEFVEIAEGRLASA
jgi:site-specific DNA-methyltransferase (adenine-specific)